MKHQTISHKETIYHAAIFLLVLLWCYTAISKWSEPAAFMASIAGQPLGSIPDRLVFWALPATEILAAVCLCFGKTRKIGLMISTFLMSAFTIYVGLVLAGYLGDVPCACGGVIRNLGWGNHFWFNIFFLATAIYGTAHHKKMKTNGPSPLGSADGPVGLPT